MSPTANIEWVWTMDRKLPSNTEQGHVAIEELIEALEKAGWEGRDLFHVQLAVEEGVVNAIEHGNRRDPSKSVRLNFKVSPELCFMQITDEGRGFCRALLKDCTDNECIEKPRGRGVHLIEQLMSETSYNEQGNQLTMLRKRFDPKLAIAEE